MRLPHAPADEAALGLRSSCRWCGARLRLRLTLCLPPGLGTAHVRAPEISSHSSLDAVDGAIERFWRGFPALLQHDARQVAENDLDPTRDVYSAARAIHVFEAYGSAFDMQRKLAKLATESLPHPFADCVLDSHAGSPDV
jgi:hypothetical protein